MKKFYLITNYDKDSQLSTTRQIVDYISNAGGTCKYQTVFSNECNKVNTDDISKDTECILVLGGDGTLIKVARDTVGFHVPLIGINFGNLGYLAEIEKNDIETTITRLMDDKYQIERRMMLHADVHRNGEIIHKSVALNDVVVSKSGNLKVLEFNVYVNGQFINKYSADGMIISTPTGSTAYNLSAGGPIVEPCADIIVLTPVSPHTLISRSVVLSADSTIEIEMCNDRTNANNQKYVYYDGDDICNLCSGDKITIRKSEQYTRIARLSEISFFETLQKKMSNR